MYLTNNLNFIYTLAITFLSMVNTAPTPSQPVDPNLAACLIAIQPWRDDLGTFLAVKNNATLWTQVKTEFAIAKNSCNRCTVTPAVMSMDRIDGMSTDELYQITPDDIGSLQRSAVLAFNSCTQGWSRVDAGSDCDAVYLQDCYRP